MAAPDPAAVRRLRARGMGTRSIARELGCTRYAVRRIVAELEGDDSLPTGPPPSPERERFKRRIRELERSHAAAAELAEAIRDAAEAVRVEVPRPMPVRVPAGKPRWSTPVAIVTHVSDMQYGEVVEAAHVPGGRYDPEVFEKERLPRWIDANVAMLEAVAAQHPIELVVVAQGGDFVEGEEVYRDQHYHLALNPGEQIVRLTAVWSKALGQYAMAAKAVGAEKVVVLGVGGNHGKRGKRAAPPSMNDDFLVYWGTGLALDGTKAGRAIDYYDMEPREAVYFEAARQVFLLTHGDQDRGGGIVGFPAVNGVNNDLAVRLQTGLSHRYHLVGHYHRPESLHVGGDSMKLWNGDWCGANKLSIGRGGGSEPTQRSYVVHPEYGICQEWPIRLAPGASRTPPPVMKW